MRFPSPPAAAADHRLVNQEVRPPARRYRTIEIQAGPHTITAAGPLPDDMAWGYGWGRGLGVRHAAADR